MSTSGVLKKRIVLWFLILSSLGCSATAAHRVVQDYAKKSVRLIALMPVQNETSDKLAANMLRTKMLEELYFKGYPKIPLDIIDSAVSTPSLAVDRKESDAGAPERVGKLLGVDATLSCTLHESDSSFMVFYTPVSLSVTCNLRSVKTGESLWEARFREVERRIGYSRRDLKLKASQVYENLIQGVVDKLMETIPDGPDLVG